MKTGQLTLGIRAVEENVGRDRLVLERKRHLDDARQAGCALAVAQVWFNLVRQQRFYKNAREPLTEPM